MTNPEKPICDFCSSKEIRWRYRCESFGLTLVFLGKRGQIDFPWFSEGDWAACETCSALIEGGKWDALAKRSVDTSPSWDVVKQAIGAGEAEIRSAVRKLHIEFQKKRVGKRFLA